MCGTAWVQAGELQFEGSTMILLLCILDSGCGGVPKYQVVGVGCEQFANVSRS